MFFLAATGAGVPQPAPRSSSLPRKDGLQRLSFHPLLRCRSTALRPGTNAQANVSLPIPGGIQEAPLRVSSQRVHEPGSSVEKDSRTSARGLTRAGDTPETSLCYLDPRQQGDEAQGNGSLRATFFNSLFSFGARKDDDRKAEEASNDTPQDAAKETHTKLTDTQQTADAREPNGREAGEGERGETKTRRGKKEQKKGQSKPAAERDTREREKNEEKIRNEANENGDVVAVHLEADGRNSAEPVEGKTRRRPWNYGRPWTEEIRRKIATRTRLAMQRLKSERAAMKKARGEEETAPRRASPAAARAPLSHATRLKLSERLRARWRDPEARVKLLQLGRERTQSEATRAAISESVRRKWREDPGYAERVREGQAKVNAAGEKRKKISDTLKRLWRDETFRQRMRTTRRPYTEERRRALSAKITAMWAERTDYRSRTVDAIRSRFDRLKVEGFPRKLGRTKIPTQRVFSRFASGPASGGSRAPDLFSLLVKQRQEFWQRMYQKLLTEEKGEGKVAEDENQGARDAGEHN
ncbi:hypothetical protein NCLIV_039550 [Neospora caninum Liverpool]|uniref:Uncharacterized protein n=1 Tax=Neospora caninum (strain Liverpool) TaxID=572307 RepID=F0VB96_NEOCL|nr:hypothetical protein NCLIV_039550 [Neospora caninum Liverpool]CBZ50880.1 hypothetical protein NCLIV_039550 [Neospora caninum Liverpool]|eukprot:XP_003880913.1 hypothetical protein NCLIV_039550 [Neospora caninum Liverpool]